MHERQIQDFLFENPQVLFPGEDIQEKSREYHIRGRYIDLLFMVGGTRYIVEIKATPIEREHIGQVIEYYGVMKEYFRETNVKMILVSPHFPQERRTYLEELGIRCFEVPKILANGLEEVSRRYDKTDAMPKTIDTANCALPNEIVSYWCLNFDSDPEILNHGIDNDFWLMQYQYHNNPQRPGTITANWRVASRIRPGDYCVAYFGKPSTFFAIGRVISPRKQATHYDTVERTIREKYHRYDEGIVHYSDAPALHEDFTDNWSYIYHYQRHPEKTYIWKYPQRIDVAKWEQVKERGIRIKGLSRETIGGYSYRLAAFQITGRFFERIKYELNKYTTEI